MCDGESVAQMFDEVWTFWSAIWTIFCGVKEVEKVKKVGKVKAEARVVVEWSGINSGMVEWKHTSSGE